MSLAFQSVAPGDYFEFAADSVLDADHGVHLEYKGREHGAKRVNRQRIGVENLWPLDQSGSSPYVAQAY